MFYMYVDCSVVVHWNRTTPKVVMHGSLCCYFVAREICQMCTVPHGLHMSWVMMGGEVGGGGGNACVHFMTVLDSYIITNCQYAELYLSSLAGIGSIPSGIGNWEL